MRTIRPAIALVLLLIAVLTIAACGSSAGAAASPAPAAPDGMTQEAPATDGVTDGSGRALGDVDGDGVGEAGGPLNAPVDDARIIRTGTIDLEVGDVGASLTKARDGIRALGGYIGASTTGNDGDRPFATVSYRIPVDRWEDALDLLRGIDGTGTKVTAEHTETVEVTGQVIDLEARIKNLRASEAALQQIAAMAVRISDVLEVQNQLTQVRGQIEQLTAQLTDLEDRAAYATLTATFQLPVVAVEIVQSEWDPKTVVDEASASLIQVLQGLTTAGIWFAIVWLPIIVAIVLIAAVATWSMRRLGLIGPRPPKGGEVAAS